MRSKKNPDRPFQLSVPKANPLLQKTFVMMQGFLERCVHFEELNSLYERIGQIPGDRPYPDKVLEAMNLRYEVSEEDLQRIPAAGPVVVVANHPFGGIEGVVMASLLLRARSDIRLMANYLLGCIPELREYFIFVDPFGAETSARANIRSMRESISWLREGHVLGVFPSGEVSHIDWSQRKIRDPAWSPTIARLVRHTRAAVLPVFFEGCNSMLFQIAGLIHPRFRTAMLPQEFVNKADRRLQLRIGPLIPFTRIEKIENEEDLTAYLRLRTYLLANRSEKDRKRRRMIRIPKRFKRAPQPVVDPTPAEVLIDEIEALPPEQRLVEHAPYCVCVATAQQAPAMLREIGRLREITFRLADEGTGAEIDLDRFDDYYLHLFVWNREKRELVGAYRLGQTDLILGRHGLKGLYTSTLFKCKKRLLQQLNPALELGRSFVRAEYQRDFAALMLLWKGIGAYVARNPRYRNLFGPVSINNEYLSTSRQLLVRFLEVNNYEDALSRLVKPKKPLKPKRIRDWDQELLTRVITDVNDVSDLIAAMEKDNKGIPILLKQYLKLGGKLLAFNVDPSFSYVLDGLIWVDLRQTDPKTLSRYMGKEGAERLLAMHTPRAP